MVKQPLLTDELKSKIGMEWEPITHEIEKGMIKKFAQAIEDPNPLWQDEEYARKSRYGGLIAPPGFIYAIDSEELIKYMVSLNPYDHLLNGGTEAEYYQPITPGDVITVTIKIGDIHEREGKTGSKVFVTFESVYKNQKHELVAKCRNIAVYY